MKKLGFLCVLMISWLYVNSQQSALEAFVTQPLVESANVGIYIKNLSTGKVMASYRENNVIPPASTMKIITTTSALEILGNDFRFPTYLETDGEIKDGILHGNLYIRGTGDPTLGSQRVGNQSFLYHWVRALRQAGIREIDGQVIADATFFDGDAINPQWIWEDIGNYYAPGIYALPYMDNTMNVQLRSGQIGSVAEVIKTLPYIEGITFENHIRCTAITYDGAYVHGVPYCNHRYLVGSVPSNRGVFGVRGDIPNPPLLLAQHLTMRLRENGIRVAKEAGFIAENAPSGRTVLYEHQSEPLSTLVKEINQESNNLYAEQVFRYLGSKIALPCTIHNSATTIQNCWFHRGISLQRCFIMDGSGLSPQDAVSAKTLVDLLSFMQQSKEKEAFIASLPVAGESGTLRSFLRDTELAGKVIAKSGTTSRIKSYAGYMYLQNGEILAFAVLVNNANGKAKNVQKAIEKLLLDVYQKNR